MIAPHRVDCAHAVSTATTEKSVHSGSGYGRGKKGSPAKRKPKTREKWKAKLFTVILERRDVLFLGDGHSVVAMHTEREMSAHDKHDENIHPLIKQAVSWSIRSGWPTRDSDLTMTRTVWIHLLASDLDPVSRGEALLRHLERNFEATGDNAQFRAVLCRLVLRAGGLDR